MCLLHPDKESAVASVIHWPAFWGGYSNSGGGISWAVSQLSCLQADIHESPEEEKFGLHLTDVTVPASRGPLRGDIQIYLQFMSSHANELSGLFKRRCPSPSSVFANVSVIHLSVCLITAVMCVLSSHTMTSREGGFSPSLLPLLPYLPAPAFFYFSMYHGISLCVQQCEFSRVRNLLPFNPCSTLQEGHSQYQLFFTNGRSREWTGKCLPYHLRYIRMKPHLCQISE